MSGGPSPRERTRTRHNRVADAVWSCRATGTSNTTRTCSADLHRGNLIVPRTWPCPRPACERFRCAEAAGFLVDNISEINNGIGPRIGGRAKWIPGGRTGQHPAPPHHPHRRYEKQHPFSFARARKKRSRNGRDDGTASYDYATTHTLFIPPGRISGWLRSSSACNTLVLFLVSPPLSCLFPTLDRPCPSVFPFSVYRFTGFSPMASRWIDDEDW